MKDILIGNKVVGADKDIFLCAEVGTTCNGDLQTAKDMIDVAVLAGLDALKFQIINPELDFSDHEMTYTYKTHDGTEKKEKMVGMLKKYMFTHPEWIEIKKYGDKNNILIFATPSHLEAVDLMEELAMPAYKICSWNANFYPLIRKIARANKPVLIDTGPASDLDLMKVIDVIKEEGNDKIMLLYCYHTNRFEDINLNTINYLEKTFHVLTGYSSGGSDPMIDYISLAYKPVAIEMRLTMDKSQEGHHHGISMNPNELVEYVGNIKKYQKLIGDCSSKPTVEEKESKDKYFRSLYFVGDMKAGDAIKEQDVSCMRPANKGIDPFLYDIIIGRTLKVDVKRNQPVTWELI